MVHSVSNISIGIIYLYMAIYALSKNSSDSRNRLNFTATFLLAIWAFINGVMFLITDPIIAASTRRFMSLCWGSLYSVIFHLIMMLSGAYDRVKKRGFEKLFLGIIYILAMINIILYFFNPYPPDALELTSKGWIIEDYFTDSFLWNNYFYFYYALLMICTIIVLFWWRKTTIKKIAIKQSELLIKTFIIALVLGSLLEIILPILGIATISGITLYIALIPTGSIWYATNRYNLMSFDPQQLTGQMLSLMSDGLMLVNEEGKVILMNTGTEMILGYTIEDEVSIDRITEVPITSNMSSVPVEFKDSQQKPLTVLVSTLPIIDKLQEVYGMVVTFQDIREIREAQDKLKSLNVNLEKVIEERTKKLRLINNDLINEIGMRREAEKRILKLANYDHLTELPNRRIFKKNVEAGILKYKSSQKKFAVLFIDLDDFKNINDTLGHKTGDELLIAISNRLNGLHLTTENVTRNGGDEFLVLINGEDDIEGEVRKISESFNDPFKVGQLSLNVTCSIGVAVFPDHGRNYEALIVSADIAMYDAKRQANYRYKFYDEKMNIGLKEELELTNDLFEAFKNKELSVHYQPIVDGSEDHIIGAEALIRWQHPQKGFIPPMVFVPLAEKTGTIDLLSNIVIESVKGVLEQLDMEKLDQFKIAINISPVQLSDESFIRGFKSYKESYAHLFNHIEIEVTENAFIQNKSIAVKNLEAVRDEGITVAIDDFGVNYSSLNYIKQLPINKLKIDKIFVDGIGHDMKDEGIIITMITLAKQLGLIVIAEGVEAKEQADFLLQHKCHFHQGYYYYKPMDASHFLRLFQ